MKKVRWGILSTAKIAVEKVIPAMQQGGYCRIVAIASRDAGKARKVSEQLSIPTWYGSYDELLRDPTIDAVYIPLPNHLHVPWSIEALQAGKHVLCEKPIGLSSEEAMKLADYSKSQPHLKLMEAFMYRFHPQWVKAKELVRRNGIGAVKAIQSFFSYSNHDPHNIRNIREMGGGGLMDIGCYCVSLSRFIFDEEPARVCGSIEFDDRFQVDRLAAGLMEFTQGVSSFFCSTQMPRYQRVHIFGSEGRIEIEIPFNAPPDRPCRIWLQEENEIQELSIDVCNQYTIQGDLFSKAILENTEVPTPVEDSVANLRVIEALFRSAERKQWVTLS